MKSGYLHGEKLGEYISSRHKLSHPSQKTVVNKLKIYNDKTQKKLQKDAVDYLLGEIKKPAQVKDLNNKKLQNTLSQLLKNCEKYPYFRGNITIKNLKWAIKTYGCPKPWC